MKKKKKEEKEEESDREDGGSDQRRGTPWSKKFYKKIPRRIWLSEEEESDGSLISEFRVSIRAAIMALIRCLGLLILLLVCLGFWFRCGFVDFAVSLMFFVVFGFVEWVSKSSL